MKSMKKGFTLVELMVVIVIIGILAALAIPRFLGATNKSKATEFKPVLKQIYTLQKAYEQERDAYSIDIALIGFDAPGSTARFSYTVPGAVDVNELGRATYVVGKNIKGVDGKELSAADYAVVDTAAVQKVSTDALANLTNLDKI